MREECIIHFLLIWYAFEVGKFEVKKFSSKLISTEWSWKVLAEVGEIKSTLKVNSITNFHCPLIYLAEFCNCISFMIQISIRLHKITRNNLVPIFLFLDKNLEPRSEWPQTESCPDQINLSRFRSGLFGPQLLTKGKQLYG